MELILHRHFLRLRHTFTIAHDSRDEQGTLIVELRDGPFSGFGEATDNKYYGVGYEQLAGRLQALRPQLANYIFAEPIQFWADMQPHLGGLPFAQCALDEAACDLYGKKMGQPLYQLWGLDPGQVPFPITPSGLTRWRKWWQKWWNFRGPSIKSS